METLQSTIFIEFDVNTKNISFLRKDNIIDYDSNATSVYVRVKYKDLNGNTIYLTSSELEGYKFTLYTIKPVTNNINEIIGEVTDELKENVSGGLVKFKIPRACTNRLGIVKCEIHVERENKRIGSSNFVLDVKQSLVTAFNDELLEDEDFPVLKQLILEIQKASSIDDNNKGANTTYSSNKIENIKEDLSSRISAINESSSRYVTKETGNANQIIFADGQTFQAKLNAGILKGDTGAIGPKGEKGEKGSKGDQGIQGLKGEKGDAFTYEDFTPEQLLALKGEKGDKGDPGEQGPQGIQGPQGVSGADSIDDTTASETTTYSGNKIETIKEDLSSQIKENKNNLTNFKNELNSYEYICPLATGNIDVDTQNVSNFFNVCIEKNYTNVLIPKGTYKISSGFDITEFQYGARISAFGAIFDVQSECDYVLRLKRKANYWSARRLTIQGLEIKGNFKAQSGIEINGVLEWCLQGVRIHDCKVGLALESTYYGEMNSECVIEGCLIGIQHRNNGSSTSEVNTIDYHNVKVNAGAGSLVVRKKWFAVNEGESDTDYNARCVENKIFQVGVQIECTTWMTKFYGLTIEGVDYGYYSCKHSTGGYYAHFIIEKNYFESIKISPIRLETLSGAGYITAKIADNHYYDYLPIIIGNGTFEIFGNTRYGFTVPLETNITRPSYVKTDSSTIVDKMTTKYTLVKQANRPLEKYLGQSYSDMGVNSDETEAYLESNRVHIADGTSFYPIYSYTNKNIHIDNPYSGVILTSANNNLYMIKVTETGELYTEAANPKVSWVTNESLGRFTGKQYKKLLDMKSPLLKEGVQQFIEYPLYEYVCLEDGVPKVTWEKKKGITTAKEYYEASDRSIFSFIFYDYKADVSFYNSNNGNNTYTAIWNFRGNSRTKSIKAIGTLAERPVDPAIEDFIYYAGDEDKYYKWNNKTKAYSAIVF